MKKTPVAEPLPWYCVCALSCAHGEFQTSVGKETVKETQDTARCWERDKRTTHVFDMSLIKNVVYLNIEFVNTSKFDNKLHILNS